MNYIAYKNIDGTITSEFKVKLYDIVTLNAGYWKDKLGRDAGHYRPAQPRRQPHPDAVGCQRERRV